MDLRRNFTQLTTAAPIFAAILVVSLLYFPSLTILWKKWVLWDQDLAHAIPTIGVMLVLLGRNTYKTTEALAPNFIQWILLLALGVCSVCWYLFESLSISLPAYFMLLAVLCLFISTSFSLSFLRATLSTFGLLIFTIPIWSELTDTLVNLSSIVVGHAVKLSNITVLLDGSSLFLPSGTIYIADGCSGIRYLIISLLMGYILILLNQYKLRVAIATLIAACALGLIANWLRIYLLVLIGYHTEMQSSLMHDHETFGWVLFACLLVPAIYFSPISKTSAPTIDIPKRPHLLPLLALGIGPLLLYFSTTNTTGISPLNLDHLSQYRATTHQRVGIQLQPGIKNKEHLNIALEGQFLRVDLFTNTPIGNREEIVPFVGKLTNGATWLQEQSIKNQHSFDVGVYKNVGGAARIIIAKQYMVGTMRTDSYLIAKLIQIFAKASNKSYFGLITVQTHCKSNCTEEIKGLANAWKIISPQQ